jgi:hypothetical protein
MKISFLPLKIIKRGSEGILDNCIIFQLFSFYQINILIRKKKFWNLKFFSFFIESSKATWIIKFSGRVTIIQMLFLLNLFLHDFKFYWNYSSGFDSEYLLTWYERHWDNFYLKWNLKKFIFKITQRWSTFWTHKRIFL